MSLFVGRKAQRYLVADKVAVDIFIKYAETFLEMGHSGKCALALQRGKSFLGYVGDQEKTRFFISYCRYLISIGNATKWFDFTNICTEFRLKITPEFEKLLEHEDVSALKQLDSQLAIMAGNPSSGLDDSYEGFKILAKLTKTLDKHVDHQIYPKFISNI
jgi:hypothetical protein